MLLPGSRRKSILNSLTRWGCGLIESAALLGDGLCYLTYPKNADWWGRAKVDVELKWEAGPSYLHPPS